MAEYTAFGLEVKTKLLGPPNRTQTWLAEQVMKSRANKQISLPLREGNFSASTAFDRL